MFSPLVFLFTNSQKLIKIFPTFSFRNSATDDNQPPSRTSVCELLAGTSAGCGVSALAHGNRPMLGLDYYNNNDNLQKWKHSLTRIHEYKSESNQRLLQKQSSIVTTYRNSLTSANTSANGCGRGIIWN